MTTSENKCPMGALLGLLAGQWTSHILWTITHNNPIQFNELKRQVSGISAKVLTERLKMLVVEGIISRNIKPTNPPQVEYDLTLKGKDLNKIFEAMHYIADKWKEKDNSDSLITSNQDSKQASHVKHL